MSVLQAGLASYIIASSARLPAKTFAVHNRDINSGARGRWNWNRRIVRSDRPRKRAPSAHNTIALAGSTPDRRRHGSVEAWEYRGGEIVHVEMAPFTSGCYAAGWGIGEVSAEVV